jgi:predicted RND superfamily exporter protein
MNMNVFLSADIIKKIPDTIVNKWFIVSFVELLVILILIIIILKKKKGNSEDITISDDIKQYKDADVDLGNMFDSMFNASKLHSILKKKIHPDRFPNDPEKIRIANDLTAKLNEAQNNIAKMKEIQDLAKEKLGIIL